MSRTKSRKRPAPPRRATTSRKEVRFPIPGHALGEQAYLLMRRRAGRWSVTDSFRGGPAFVGVGEVWQELKPDTTEADLYCWTEPKARALVARFVQQAVEIARNNRALDAAFVAAETARRLEELAARMVPQQVVPEVVNLQYMGERLREAEAEVAARIKRRAPVEDDTITVRAPMDHPDWRPEPPDPAPEEKLLSRVAADISANSEQETAALDVRRVRGPAVTAVMPVLPEWPPLPDKPPTVHLKYLAETHPSTGARIARSVADALANH